MMLSFDVGNNKFNYRPAVIIVNDNKVLFQTPINEDIWFLPGGRVEFFETAITTIHREMIEEFDLEIDHAKLIWIVENFFELQGKNFHEIGLYYLISISDQTLLKHEKEFTSMEKDYLNKWISFDEFNDYNIVPKFVKEELKNLDENQIKHIIYKDKRE